MRHESPFPSARGTSTARESLLVPLLLLALLWASPVALGQTGTPAAGGTQEGGGEGIVEDGGEAGGQEGERDSTWELRWRNTFRLTSPDGRTRLRFGGRIQNDWAFYGGDDGVEARVGELEDGSELRRARLYFQGELWELVEFKAQFDFAGSGNEARDVYVGLVGLPAIGGVRVGHYKEPFSLEELTSSKYLQFLERALPVLAFAPVRNNGFMIGQGAGGERFTWNLGAFKEVDEPGESLGDEWNLTGRVTGLPLHRDGGRSLLHLGLAVSERSPEDDLVRFRARPESHLAPRLVDTGTFLADGVTLVGLEAALVEGPFSVQGEWMEADVDALAGPDPSFGGYYLTVGWMLTGEHRAYSGGHFGRLSPRRPVHEGGWGAWEIAARISHLDLADAGVDGGELDDFTLGVNAWLTSNVRTLLDFVRADLDGVGEVEAVQLRFQVDF